MVIKARGEDWTKIRLSKKHLASFENFDFFYNGGHLKSKMTAIMDLKWPPFPSYIAPRKRKYLEF